MSQTMLQISAMSSYLVSLVASACRACKHFTQAIPYDLTMFFCDLLFLFPFYFFSQVNKLDSDYFPSIFNASALVEPYSLMTYVNLGNSITGIEPRLINFTMSSECLKFSSTLVVIDYLNSMNWNFSLILVGDINNFKLSPSPVNLLIWC